MSKLIIGYIFGFWGFYVWDCNWGKRKPTPSTNTVKENKDV